MNDKLYNECAQPITEVGVLREVKEYKCEKGKFTNKSLGYFCEDCIRKIGVKK